LATVRGKGNRVYKDYTVVDVVKEMKNREKTRLKFTRLERVRMNREQRAAAMVPLPAYDADMDAIHDEL